MKTQYAELTNSELVALALKRMNLTQAELASMFYISQSRISEALTGKGGLRPKVRQAMIDLLETQDNNGKIYQQGTVEIRTA